MKRMVANYGRPHANKRPAELASSAEAKQKRSCSPRAAGASAAHNPLVQRAQQAGGAGFGSYVDKLVGSQAAGGASAPGGSATRQLKEQLKEQLEAEERRSTSPATPAAATTDDAPGACSEPSECDTGTESEMQSDECSAAQGVDSEAHANTAAAPCPAPAPATPAAALAESAVQVDSVPMIAVEIQTDAMPEPQLDPAVDCTTQTEPLAEKQLVEVACQCEAEPEAPATTVAETPADESTPMEESDSDETPAADAAAATDPFAFPQDHEEVEASAASSSSSVTAAAAPDGSTEQAQAQMQAQAQAVAEAKRLAEMARRKKELLAESAANAERAAAAEATEAAAKLEKARGQVINLEFANDLLMQQVGELKNQLRSMGGKEQAARFALTKMQQDHTKEVARWQTMMDSTVQSVQGQMAQLLQGTTQKMSALQQQVQDKDAQLAQFAQLQQHCAQLEAVAAARDRQSAAAAAAAADSHRAHDDDEDEDEDEDEDDEIGQEEADADALFAAVDSVEEDDDDDDDEEEMLSPEL
jgi:hypothetical protein